MTSPGMNIGARRTSGRVVVKKPDFDVFRDALQPLSDDERLRWPGWVELESDPTLFSYILRQYGVRGVQAQDLFALDDESLAGLPQPVYGFIFLFKYLDDDCEEIPDAPKCPKSIWFANQTTTNACATVALMNIVMNVPELDIGDKLRDFKELTRNLKPPYRGKKLGADDFIRNIHNSFARKIDILNADLALQNDYEKWVKAQKNSRRKAYTTKSKKKSKDDDEAGYHFIAYVPINGSVWRLDGLQREPENLGESQNWISTARDNIIDRIQQYESEGVEYNLMALTKSSLQTAIDQLAENLKIIIEILEQTAVHLPEINNAINQKIASNPPKMIAMLGVAKPLGPEAVHQVFAQYGMTEAQVMSMPVPDDVQTMLRPIINHPVVIMQMYESVAAQHNAFCVSVEGESRDIAMEDAQTEERKVDHAPKIYEAVNTLVESGVLKKIIKDLREQKSK